MWNAWHGVGSNNKKGHDAFNTGPHERTGYHSHCGDDPMLLRRQSCEALILPLLLICISAGNELSHPLFSWSPKKNPVVCASHGDGGILIQDRRPFATSFLPKNHFILCPRETFHLPLYLKWNLWVFGSVSSGLWVIQGSRPLFNEVIQECIVAGQIRWRVRV